MVKKVRIYNLNCDVQKGRNINIGVYGYYQKIREVGYIYQPNLPFVRS